MMMGAPGQQNCDSSFGADADQCQLVHNAESACFCLKKNDAPLSRMQKQHLKHVLYFVILTGVVFTFFPITFYFIRFLKLKMVKMIMIFH